MLNHCVHCHNRKKLNNRKFTPSSEISELARVIIIAQLTIASPRVRNTTVQSSTHAARKKGENKSIKITDKTGSHNISWKYKKVEKSTRNKNHLLAVCGK